MSDTTKRLIDVERESRQVQSDAQHAASRITSILQDTHTVDRLADADLEAIGVEWSKLCTLQTEARKLLRYRRELRSADA